MNLSIQLQSLLISFIFGLCFSYLIRLQYKYLFYSKIYVKIGLSFLLSIDSFLLYFLVLRLVNYGVFHYYFLIMLILGYIFGYKLTKLYRKL